MYREQGERDDYDAERREREAQLVEFMRLVMETQAKEGMKTL